MARSVALRVVALLAMPAALVAFQEPVSATTGRQVGTLAGAPAASGPVDDSQQVAPTAAGAFGSITPTRALDTRVGTGAPAKAIAAGGTIAVQATGIGGIPSTGIAAVAVNITALSASNSGYLIGWANGTPRAHASIMNFTAHQDIANQVILPVGTDGKIALYNGSPGTIQLIADLTGFQLAADRSISTVVTKPTTAAPAADQVQSVTGDPAGSQTTVLAVGSPVPPVGGTLVVPASTSSDGVLGQVGAVSTNSDGSTTVTTSPAALDQAYSTFQTSVNEDLSDADVSEVPAAARLRPQAAASPAPGGFGFNLAAAAFDCQGSGAGPTITLTADLSKVHLDFSLDADPVYPNVHFLLTAYPVFDLNIGFTAQLTCTLSGSGLLQAKLPIPAAPGLAVILKPVIELSAQGQVSIDFQWSPRAVIGFDKSPDIDQDIHAFGSSGSVSLNATAGADAFLGLSVELSLAGRLGVSGDFGPDLAATYDAGTQCVTVDGSLKADLSADADVFVKHWTFALATGTFATRQLYQDCLSQPPVITTTTLPGATVGTSYSTQLTTADHRTGSWAVSAGSLPAGLGLSGYTISGVPTTAGTVHFTLTFTDSNGLTDSAAASIVVAASGTGGSVSPLAEPDGVSAGLNWSPNGQFHTRIDQATGDEVVVDGATQQTGPPITDTDNSAGQLADNGTLVYYRVEDSGFPMYLSKFGDTSRTLIDANPDDTIPGPPQLSADGSTLAYLKQAYHTDSDQNQIMDESLHLYTVATGGDRVTAHWSTQTPGELMPLQLWWISNDGSQLLADFCTSLGAQSSPSAASECTSSGLNGSWAGAGRFASADPTALQQLAGPDDTPSGSPYDQILSVSADGSTIHFWEENGSSRNDWIYRSATGFQAAPVIGGLDCSPTGYEPISAFSADGRYTACTTYDSVGNRNYYLVDLSDGSRTQIGANDPFATDWIASDGSGLIYCEYGSPDEAGDLTYRWTR